MAVNNSTSTKVNGKLSACPGSNSRCLLCCAGTGNNHSLCDSCIYDLPLINNFCPGCASPLHDTAYCGQCLSRKSKSWVYAFAAYEYKYPVNKLIHALKFGENHAAAKTLGELAARALPKIVERFNKPDAIIPVPLHYKRQFNRGFNQANEIAFIIGNRMNVPVLNMACKRIRHTQTQSLISQHKRRSNITNAFACSTSLCSGKNVVVLDDVITTGSTLESLTTELLNKGAKSVSIWALAKQTLRHKQ